MSHERVSISSAAPSERSERPRRVQVTPNASNNSNQFGNVNPEMTASYSVGPRSTPTGTVPGHGQVDGSINFNKYNTGTGATPTPTVINSGYMQHGQYAGPSAGRRYPEFLSFTETLYLQLSWAYSGLKDGLRLDRVIRILVG